MMLRFADFPSMFSYAVNMIGDGRADHLYLYRAVSLTGSESFVLSRVNLRHAENKYESFRLIDEMIRGGEE